MVLPKLRHEEQQGKVPAARGGRGNGGAGTLTSEQKITGVSGASSRSSSEVLGCCRSRGGEGRLAAAHGCREGQQRRQRQGAGRGSTQPWQGGGDGLLMEKGAREKEVARRKEKGTELVAVGG